MEDVCPIPPKSNLDKFTSEVNQLKQPLLRETTGNNTILGKRAHFRQFEDQSKHTGRQSSEFENMIINGYYPQKKNQMNFFDHADQNEEKYILIEEKTKIL